jgi:hypothetical protein
MPLAVVIEGPDSLLLFLSLSFFFFNLFNFHIEG